MTEDIVWLSQEICRLEEYADTVAGDWSSDDDSAIAEVLLERRQVLVERLWAALKSADDLGACLSEATYFAAARLMLGREMTRADILSCLGAGSAPGGKQ